MQKKSFFITFIFALLFTIIFCSSEKTYTVKIKDGVRHVHNRAPLWGNEPKVALEFVQKIGGMDATDENYQFYKPYDILCEAVENLYILDHGNYRIQKFDIKGKYLTTIGRMGQGPGEFTFPLNIDIDNDGNLYVGEGGYRYILVLTNAGKEVKRIKLPGLFENFRLSHSDKILIPTPPGLRRRAENIARDTRLISLCDVEGNLIKEFGELKDYNNRDMTYFGNAFYFCVDINDNIYVTFYDQNRIEKYSHDGNLIFRADRPLNYKVGLDKEKSVTLPTKFIPFFYPVSEGICLDHKNRIWVHTYKKQEEEDDKPVDMFEFEIFDNEGVLLGKIPPPKNFNFMRIFNDRLFLVDRKEEMCVYEYKIVEK